MVGRLDLAGTSSWWPQGSQGSKGCATLFKLLTDHIYLSIFILVSFSRLNHTAKSKITVKETGERVKEFVGSVNKLCGPLL